VYELHFK